MSLPLPSFSSAAALVVATINTRIPRGTSRLQPLLPPTRKVSRPFARRVTRLAYLRRYLKGTLPKDLLAFHDCYGPIVRIAPKELAFNDPEAWRIIYGHKTEEFPKPNRAVHQQLLLQIALQFGDRSMREQEPMIGKYMDLLVKRLRESCIDSTRKDEKTGMESRQPLDLFGGPFGCLDRVKDDDWIRDIMEAMEKGPIIASLTCTGLDNALLPLLRRILQKGRALHDERTLRKLKRRMELKVERHELIEGFLRIKDLDSNALRSNASVLILAGSETTSTLLSGLTYLLSRNPQALKKLTDEARSSLRRYPPVSVGLPRMIPKGGSAVIAGEVIPDEAAYHSAENFTDPFSFHPERFLHDPRFANDKLDIVQPFSVGPRNCVSRNLAYAEMRLILAKITYKFDMQLADENLDWLDHKQFFLNIKPGFQCT
ncbi:cytochrome P450 [Immersiella caudata]|uniref:Cytochrome P450 n=1 Tax=Immersiella caudata TaxID=314043 RepID=A0AA39U504_9PEZI|nr:cytochrome P450 [Immersiella caudata]